MLDLPEGPFLDEMNAALAKLNYCFEMRKVSLFRPGLGRAASGVRSGRGDHGADRFTFEHTKLEGA